MKQFIPKSVYYEEDVLNYETGKKLIEKYKEIDIPMNIIKSHNKIEELRIEPYENFTRLKKNLVLGVRKSIRLVPNKLSSDYIIPFTSSGCTAMCTYCYLVATFFHNSYLRIYVNRERIIEYVKKQIQKEGQHKVYELGSNSDMVLENTITGNLRWAIDEFGKLENATATFATKFSMVDDLLDAKHNGNTQMRISVNPKHIIRKIEIGTSNLESRIDAANKMFRAGYKLGVNLAPIILIDNWKELYVELIQELHDKLDIEMHDKIFFELIFMTYGLANHTINQASMPNVVDVFNKDIMRPKGRGKYCYRDDVRAEAEHIITEAIHNYFPDATISYIV